MKIKYIILVFAYLSLFGLSIIPTYGHSGRTNSEGCHNCNVGACAGTYHCHNGGAARPSSYNAVPVPTRTPNYIYQVRPTSSPVSHIQQYLATPTSSPYATSYVQGANTTTNTDGSNLFWVWLLLGAGIYKIFSEYKRG